MCRAVRVREVEKGKKVEEGKDKRGSVLLAG
jgi:hypothetical protein